MRRSLELSISLNKRAERLRILNIVCIIFIVLTGSIIGVISLMDEINYKMYVIASLGFAITSVQTLLSTFSVGKRSVLYKENSNKLRKIYRTLKNGNVQNLEDLFQQVDDIEIFTFISPTQEHLTIKKINNNVEIEIP